MIAAIHQPHYLPWVGYLDKLMRADVFVLLDCVQYRKNYFQNRNVIRTAQGRTWLTVPVLSSGCFGQNIGEVKIDGKRRWAEEHWKSIYFNYKKARYFDVYAESLGALYRREWHLLTSVAEATVRWLVAILQLPVRTVRASELGATGVGNHLLLDICRRVGADVYLSGKSGRKYLDLDGFRDEGISVLFQDFVHPTYRQVFDPFMPGMAAIDMVFSCGPETLDLLRRSGTSCSSN